MDERILDQRQQDARRHVNTRRLLYLDAPIARWLPYYRADTGARLTLRRLLSNSSGLPKMFLPAAAIDPTLRTRDVPTAEAVKRFASGDLYFEPGAKFDYVLENWIIVDAVIEVVTGQPFHKAMHALTLDPLGLRNTGAAAAMSRARKQCRPIAPSRADRSSDSPFWPPPVAFSAMRTICFAPSTGCTTGGSCRANRCGLLKLSGDGAVSRAFPLQVFSRHPERKNPGDPHGPPGFSLDRLAHARDPGRPRHLYRGSGARAGPS
ncbi:MAG: serine hydrolase domain-containing protein [Sphingomonas sp.]|uniref:serine hydrolase domain-containing protein n=1 Tax=Sphingomonas sp. TaxID=28214 RepID=UPI0030FA73B8